MNQELSILKKEFHEKEKEYRKIKNKFEESDLLSKSDDDDLRQMFSCLNSGFSEMNKKKVQIVFGPIVIVVNLTVGALINHVSIDHIANQEQSDQPPIMKKYKCNWEKCTAGHFDKEDYHRGPIELISPFASNLRIPPTSEITGLASAISSSPDVMSLSDYYTGLNQRHEHIHNTIEGTIFNTQHPVLQVT